MSNKKVLILTDKKINIFRRGYRFFKMVLKEGLILKQWHHIFRNHFLGGSIEIPRNLINGLYQKNFEFDHNVYRKNVTYDAVIVIKNIDALKWALKQKEKGLIKQLIVGPFISTLPTDNHSILENSLIDRLIFLCEWHRKIFYSLYGQPQIPYSIWFAGIDPNKWAPEKSNQNKQHVLIYKKYANPVLTQHIENYLNSKKLLFHVIKCGNYQQEDYKSLLQKSFLTIFIAHSETQGLAIFESWSMNVPTLHWDPGFMDYFGAHYPNSSSCPYLTNELGASFNSEKDFAEAFESIYKKHTQLEPRKKMVLEFSNEKSVQVFIDIINKHLSL